MNFVPCLAWVAKGIAKSCPDKLQLSPDELKSLIEETKNSIDNNREVEEEQSDLSASDEEDETVPDISDEEENEEDDSSEVNDEPTSENDDAPDNKDELTKEERDEDDDINAKYDMDDYDNDDDDRPLLKIADVATYVDNKEDNYITDYAAVNEDEEEDNEDFIIRASDNLLVTGHVEEESSTLEVHIYNKEEDTFYVHHDIVLPAYPLALEWLDYHPSDDTPGNYIAVGDMTPVIKIWDLDIVEVLEPDYCLGEKMKRKKKDGEKMKLKYHKDAVISLSWNKHLRNILASGSADFSIIVWDLQKGTALNKLKFHTNKVQSLQWHPFESSFLLSSCTDGLIKVYDCRAPDAECKSWNVDGEVERVCWNLFDSLKFFCSTDTGFVHSFDLRNSEIEHTTKAHLEGVTGLDMCNQHPDILLTASMDKTLKLWDIKDGFKLINSQKLKVGSVYAAKFSPDSELPVAVGGNNASNNLKILDLADVLGSPTESKDISQESEKNFKSGNIKMEDNIFPKKIKLEQQSTSGGQMFKKSGNIMEDNRFPKKIKLEQSSTSGRQMFKNIKSGNIKMEDNRFPKKIKLEQPSTSGGQMFKKSGNIKIEDNRFPKKIKLEKPSTSAGQEFNHGAQKKQFHFPESVKRIHKTYT